MFEDVIKYYDEDSWRRYFSVDVAEFYSSVEGLLRLRRELVEELTSDSVGNLITKSNIYMEILFGGLRVSESKPLTDNALALFYKNVFGVGLKDEDLRKVVTRLREGLTLEKAAEDMHCTVENTSILEILQDTSLKLEAVYKSLRGVVEKPKPKEYKLNTSTIGLEAMQDVLNAGKKLLPLYNPLSFFIISIYSIPKFYATEAYTKLFEKDTQSLLKKYGIHITKLVEPDLPDEKIRSEREVVGLEDDCVGYLIRKVILNIYLLFQREILRHFFTIEDEFNKYINIYANKLKVSIVVEKFNDVIGALKNVGSKANALNIIKDMNLMISNYEFYYGEGSVVGGEVKIRDYGVNYTKFFAFLAPQMFLGLARVRPYTSAKWFDWLCTLGWEK
ncbi:hypothetical protein QPL79_05910 [Ignisphaera sp. 4213-co]|uniref:Uncharacterized protein n=1 Tax=Ignisphaera cupida TaxID=3050454 RepID=A0ABD4Z8K4_9CREN|nr:hypothetical protein [Ignisphaera sp. 4213-co]MDK6028893.1 hypothetical protein [Ignisphaera sp. 4213-co]